MLITLKKKRVENRSKRWNTETLGWIKAVTDQKHLALYFWKHLWTTGEPFRNTYCHSWFLCWWMDYYRKRPWSFLTSLFGGVFFFFFFSFWNNFRQDNFENNAKNSYTLSSRFPGCLPHLPYHFLCIYFFSDPFENKLQILYTFFSLHIFSKNKDIIGTCDVNVTPEQD